MSLLCSDLFSFLIGHNQLLIKVMYGVVEFVCGVRAVWGKQPAQQTPPPHGRSLFQSLALLVLHCDLRGAGAERPV